LKNGKIQGMLNSEDILKRMCFISKMFLMKNMVLREFFEYI